MQPVTVFVNQFDGGMVNDPREPAVNCSRILQHFDAFTNKHKLTPYRSAASGDGSASTHKIANFVYANGIFYGLGVVDGTGFGAPASEPALFKNTDLTGSTWSADSHGSSPTGAITTSNNRSNVETAAFAYYPTTGRIYGVRDLRYAWSVNPATSFNNAEADLGTFAYCSNYCLHSKDDILYLGHDNKVSLNNNGSWTVAAFTVPSTYVITSLCEFGDFLAIACRSKTRGHSKVFLWDRDTTRTTANESIDWGEGELMLIEELEGYLVGVSFQYVVPGSTSLDDQMVSKTRTIFRYYLGIQGAAKFAEFTGASTSPSVAYSTALAKQKVNNRIFFMATIPIGTTGYQGIWSIGRNSIGEPFGVTCDRLLNNGTAVNGIYGFMLLGDYMYAAYDVSGTFAMDKSDSSANYTATSVVETTINPGMPALDRMKLKQLMSVGLMYEALPSGAQAVLKYRVDGGSWTTVFTESTAGRVYTEPYTKTSGSGEFTQGKEYEFRIESTGGAEISGLIYKYQSLKSNV